MDMDAVERYVVDEKGQRVAVILSLEEYQKIRRTGTTSRWERNGCYEKNISLKRW